MYSVDLTETVEELFFITPAAVQYKVRKEERTMSRKPEMTRVTTTDNHTSTLLKEPLHRPASY
jgi:hypothetical protein